MNQQNQNSNNTNSRRIPSFKNAKLYTRPTHFFAIQISNPEIHKVLNDIQKKIVSYEGAYPLKKVLIPCTEFHITLCLAAFENGELIKRVIDAFNNRSSEIKAIFDGGIKLHVEKLKTFNNQVLYASIRQDEAYRKLFNLNIILKEIIVTETNEACLTESSFYPHITLMKFSKFRKELKYNGWKKIDKHLYEEYIDNYFGEQGVFNVQLLKMSDRNQEGYYKKLHQLNFICDIPESLDHSECCQQYYNKEKSKRASQKIGNSSNLPSTSQEPNFPLLTNRERKELLTIRSRSKSQNKININSQLNNEQVKIKPLKEKNDEKNGLYTLMNFLCLSLSTYIISQKLSQI